MSAYVEDAPVRRTSTAMAELVVEILWNQGPNASDGDWCDIAEYVVGWWFDHGRENELEDFSAGNGEVTVETFDRLFDSSYTSGPWYPWLTVNRQIRIYEVWDGVRIPIGRGYINDFGDTIESDEKYTTTISFGDGFERGEHIALPDSFVELYMDTDRPTHWWKLGEGDGVDVLDSGYGTPVTGTYLGEPELGAEGIIPYGGTGTAVTLAGTYGVAQQINLPISLSATDGYTISVWFKAGAQSTTLPPIVANSLLTMNGTTGTLPALGTAVVNDDVVHHAVLVQQPSSASITVYVDGTVSYTTAGGVSITSPVQVGYLSTPTREYPFLGTVQSIAIWDGVALTATQVLNHYHAGKDAFTGDDTGTHLARVLDAKRWPVTLRSIDTGASTIGAHDLGGGNLASFIRAMGSTELGQTYFDADGNLDHRSRHNLVLDSRSSTSQATFGDTTSGAALRYLEDGFDFPLDNTQIRNPVRATRNGGATAVARDNTLIEDWYGDNSYDAPESLDADDNVMLDRANLILDRWKRPARRLNAMDIDPTMDPTNLQPQMARKIGDRITVQRTPLAEGNQISADVIIQKVHHEGTQFTRRATFSGTTAETRRYWILGDATYGLLGDTTILGY